MFCELVQCSLQLAPDSVFGDSGPDTRLCVPAAALQLASSDDEENTPAWGGKIRSWLTGQKPPRGATPLTGLTGQKGGMKPSRLPLGPAPCPITVEALRGESTVEGVRRLAVRIIDEYDAVAHRQFKLENKTAKLQAMVRPT